MRNEIEYTIAKFNLNTEEGMKDLNDYGLSYWEVVCPLPDQDYYSPTGVYRAFLLKRVVRA